VTQDGRKKPRSNEKKLVRCLDKRRRHLLRAGSIERAAHLSIGQVLVLARMGWRERIAPVVEELRAEVRRTRRHGEALFALYQVVNAVEQGTDVTVAAAGALARLARRERTNDSSGADSGAGVSERRSGMEMMQSEQEQELKSERVQEEMAVQKAMAVQEPYLVSLKSERVQEPELFSAGEGSRAISVIELAMSRMIAVTIELQALQAVVTLHGAQGESPGQTS
jgi:hypothetical protein